MTPYGKQVEPNLTIPMRRSSDRWWWTSGSEIIELDDLLGNLNGFLPGSDALFNPNTVTSSAATIRPSTDRFSRPGALRTLRSCARVETLSLNNLKRLVALQEEKRDWFSALTTPASTPWRGWEVAFTPCRWLSRTSPSSASGTCGTDRATLCPHGFLDGQDLLPTPHFSTPGIDRSVKTTCWQHLAEENVSIVIDGARTVSGPLQKIFRHLLEGWNWWLFLNDFLNICFQCPWVFPLLTQ